MSATTAAANHRRMKVDPIGLRLWFWTSSLIVVGTLLSQGDDLWASLRDDIGYILLWTIAMAFADYLEVRFWRGVHLTMSLTVGIAAAMVFDLSVLLAGIAPAPSATRARGSTLIFGVLTESVLITHP